MRSFNRSLKRGRGSAITEFGPAMFVLLIVFFFPMLNLIALALSYTDCLYLNYLLLRQAGLERTLVIDSSGKLVPDYTCSTDPNGSLNRIITAWQANGLGQFASTGSMPKQTIYIVLAEGTPSVKYVHLNLSVDVKPFLPVPFPIAVPGLNAPVTFNYSGRSIIEYVPS